MINSSDIIKYDKLGFDWDKYISLQKEKILERIDKFLWRLYLEIWWKFMYDTHAARVLPGFNPESKKEIFYSLREKIEILFCVNWQDIITNRQLTNEGINYSTHIKILLEKIIENIWVKPKIVINKLDYLVNNEKIDNFFNTFKSYGYEVYKRYLISWYPKNTDLILSINWFWKDNYINLEKNLILVTWAASNSWKLSTCLGQMYIDNIFWIASGYAKYETFPIWNLDLNHPINLAYEAATADIWDYNAIDELHEKFYFIKSVNYNRDIEAFDIIKWISDKFLSKDNYTSFYKSPTDMWISNAWYCITDDEICSQASLEEINRRKIWYTQMLQRGKWKKEWIENCKILEKKCVEYIKEKNKN